MSSGTHVTNWGGAMEETSGNLTWINFGFAILLYIPAGVSGDALGGPSIDMETLLPSSLRPTAERVSSGLAINDGNSEQANFTVGTDGSITVTLSSQEDFSSTGTNGLPAHAITYIK